MLTNAAAALFAAPNASPRAAPPQAAGPAGRASFARALQQAVPPPREKPQPPAKDPAASRSEGNGERKAEMSAEKRAEKASKQVESGAEKPVDQRERIDTADKASPESTGDVDDIDDDEAPDAPDLSPWLSSAMPPAPVASGVTRDGLDGDAAAADMADATVATPPGSGKGTGTDKHLAADRLAHAGADLGTHDRQDHHTSGEAVAGTEPSGSGAGTPAAAAASTARESPAALPGGLPAGLGVAGSHRADAAPAHAASPFEAHLAAALDSPDFGPTLGSQLSLLVRNGVQQARLQLNPAEMGPIAVQIALDGTQARIEFSADLAATRAALENSLPDLAAALSASGLTLAGGGVFQQARGQPDAAAPGAAPGHPGGDAAAADDAPVEAPRATRGVVDLYA